MTVAMTETAAWSREVSVREPTFGFSSGLLHVVPIGRQSRTSPLWGGFRSRTVTMLPGLRLAPERLTESHPSPRSSPSELLVGMIPSFVAACVNDESARIQSRGRILNECMRYASPAPRLAQDAERPRLEPRALAEALHVAQLAGDRERVVQAVALHLEAQVRG